MTPETLAQWRIDNGITQIEAAARFGIGERQLRRWERGEARVHPLAAEIIVRDMKGRKA